ncbi:MAG: DUF3108 domain-containing protein [Gammaproteobacteria bacterium]|nr:MAG: DUF3108 domain-containing protein [Gammaproteobacteria bacterium]
MLKISKTLIAIITLQVTCIATASPVPNFTAIYDVTKSGIALGEMRSQLTINPDNSYTYSSKTEPVGLASLFSSETVTETSQGILKKNNFTPKTYTYKRAGGDRNQNTTITFDHAKKNATDVTNDKTTTLKIDNSITDRQIIQILLMNDMLAGSTKLEYKVINKQEIKPYSFRILEHETIETELGVFKTTPVVRKREGSSRETTLWLAHELYYLPVKIEQTKNGSTKFEMEIIKLTGIAVPPKKAKELKAPLNLTNY